jgi:hypothetical protein
MRKLRVVRKDDRPVRGRGAAVSSEVRYRYPAEEIWEVSEDRWPVAEKPNDRRKPSHDHTN